jgi:hypothetical protein
MLSMLKRHEVEIRLKAGHGKTEVARLTGVSLCSVKRIAQEGPVMHVDDAAERADDWSAGPAWWRISGNQSLRFCSTHPISRRWSDHGANNDAKGLERGLLANCRSHFVRQQCAKSANLGRATWATTLSCGRSVESFPKQGANN